MTREEGWQLLTEFTKSMKPLDKAAAIQAARDEVLAQWRGREWVERTNEQARPARPASSVLPRVLAGIGLDKKRAQAEVLKVWNHLLDPNVVAHAQPTGLRNGTLFVAVDSHVWLDEIIRYRRREILQRLQHSFGRDLITRISFRVG